MNIKKLVLLLFINYFAVAMDNKNTSYKELKYPKKYTIENVKLYNEYDDHNNFEQINLDSIDVITQETFKKLIQEHTKKGNLKYVLASVLVKEDNGYGRHYHDAASLYEWMYNDNFERIKEKHVITQQKIESVDFFSIDSLDKNFSFLCSESDLLQKNNRGKRYRNFLTKYINDIKLDNQDQVHNYKQQIAQKRAIALQKKKRIKKAKKVGMVIGRVCLGICSLGISEITCFRREMPDPRRRY